MEELLPLVYDELRRPGERLPASRACWAHAAEDGPGARGVSAAHRSECWMAKPRAFLRHCGADDATDPCGSCAGS